MSKSKELADKQVHRSVIYEVYFDLWGMPMNWMEAIYKKLEPLDAVGSDDNLEFYRCPACMAIRFQSTDAKKVDEAERIFRKLQPLAMKNCPDPSQIYYDC